MLQKYPEYDISKKPSEQLEVLRSVGDEAVPIKLREDIIDPRYYVNGQCVSNAVYYDNEDHMFRSVLDSDVYISALREYYTLEKNGLLSEQWDHEDELARVFLAQGGCADKPFIRREYHACVRRQQTHSAYSDSHGNFRLFREQGKSL